MNDTLERISTSCAYSSAFSHYYSWKKWFQQYSGRIKRSPSLFQKDRMLKQTECSLSSGWMELDSICLLFFLLKKMTLFHTLNLPYSQKLLIKPIFLTNCKGKEKSFCFELTIFFHPIYKRQHAFLFNSFWHHFQVIQQNFLTKSGIFGVVLPFLLLFGCF